METTYTNQKGQTVPVPSIVIPDDINRMFKVNIPATREDEENGVGEGMWACTTEEGFDAWEKDEEGIHFVCLLNDSMYYPGMNYGSVIPVNFRVGQRPVALYEELLHHYGQAKKDDVLRFLLPKAKKKL